MSKDIEWDEIVKEAETPEPDTGFVSSIGQFQQTLEKLTPIDDFAEVAALKSEEKLKRSHIVVVIVQAVITAMLSIGSAMRYFHGSHHCFVGTHWHRVSEPVVRAFLRQAAGKCGHNETEGRHHRFVTDLEQQLRSDTETEAPARDGELHLMNLENGTLEVCDGSVRLRKHDREDMFTHVLPFPYEPDAPAPIWDNFLGRCVPEDASQMNLAEFQGSVFTRVNHEKMLVLIGAGHNGKSVYHEVQSGLLGPGNVTYYSLEALNGEYNRAGLTGSLLNYSSELSRNIKPDVFKKLISQEPIDARLPYGKPFVLRDIPRFAFNSNELPRDIEHSHAFFRRFLIIPFEVQITHEERVLDLAKQILATEASGVLNWVIQGMLRVIEQQGFSSNPAAVSAVERYKLESDSVAVFLLDERYVPSLDPEHVMKASLLYTGYRDWCVENGFKAVNRVNFGKRMRSLEFDRVHKNNGTHYLVAKTSADDPEKADFLTSHASPI